MYLEMPFVEAPKRAYSGKTTQLIPDISPTRLKHTGILSLLGGGGCGGVRDLLLLISVVGLWEISFLLDWHFRVPISFPVARLV